MAKVVGDIAVQVGADVSGLERGMKRGSRAVGNFESKTAAMARVGVQAGAAVAAAMGTIAVKAIAASKEITILSRLSGVGAEEFQRLAAAGETVGFSAEKMADIFKDVNDKFGDFMETGAGPLADFFENIAPQIGVTAEQFAKLSGPDALQLYVDSLEKAGVSQQQMTFYMEALANDATALVPLLRDNGKAMRELGDAAQEAGAIIDEALIGHGNEMADKWREIMNKMVGYTYSFALQSLKFLDDAFGVTDSGQLVAETRNLQDLMTERHAAIVSLEDERAMFGRSNVGGGDMQTGKAQGLIDVLDKEIALVIANTTALEDAAMQRQEVITSLAGGRTNIKGSDTKSGGGGGAKGEGFEAFQQTLADQTEAIDFWREEQLTKLQAFRDQKIATEQEYNELEKHIELQHATALAEIQARAFQQKTQAIGGALGDLAVLMSSENEKMFKIGKAAALAHAVVDGYRAATAAWAHGMSIGGPGMAAAFTAASLAKTGALIAGIASASPNGSGGSGAGAASSTPVAAAPAAASTSTAVSLQLTGGDMFSRDQVEGLITAINEAQEDGSNVVNIV